MERWQGFIDAAPATGEVEFSVYMQALRDAGLRGENWLRAKHAGAISTRLDENGQVLVSRAPVGGQE